MKNLIDLNFFRVSYWGFVSFSGVLLTRFLFDPSILVFVSVHLRKHSLLPDFTGLLRPGKTFISQLRLEYWTSQLVASGRWGLLLGLLDL